ncbi:hypothetical protein GUITHDRAFT_154356 [Guillardia theta CCMP2712]|uniref:FDX-ACB domain-containing protein n=2 Tax=Guillardia theta TaxID=55529 RepID=L1IU17_GUITC|nr:hypothetical protein GUITHDRAFT_154356 [Guillardia theta CCMP2712]EKX39733.1 hypothetical protein GUITHDRAFT_154356 [Guillardia theta CCMP2712]|eukprot:XP_005826713.1 hypothetical protein GUITHDRAFT_154356 [Guillardia theta CCMP2712]
MQKSWGRDLSFSRQGGEGVAGTVVVVGDGNLSYSLALKQAFPSLNLLATTFDPFHVLEERYGAVEAIKELKSLGAAVMHEVDATNMAQTVGAHYRADCIIFNFPHHPGKGKIHKNRELLRGFFLSAANHLTSIGEIRVALCAGQGGTPQDKPRCWGDSWQITAQAAAAGLILIRMFPFEAPEGYSSSGYKSQNKGFRTEEGLVHVFVPDDRGFRGIHPPTWAHDISMWVKRSFQDDDFIQLALSHPEVYSVQRFDSFERKSLPPAARDVFKDLPEEYQESRSFRVMYRSETKAISQELARDLQLKLREEAVTELRIVLR